MMEWHGFRILRLEKDRNKQRMRWLLPIVWGLRVYAQFLSKKKWENYRLEETLSKEIIMGGNTLIIVGEKA
jgi:hypothetical protein